MQISPLQFILLIIEILDLFFSRTFVVKKKRAKFLIKSKPHGEKNHCIFPCCESCSQQFFCCIAIEMSITPYQSKISLISMSDLRTGRNLGFIKLVFITCLYFPLLNSLFTTLSTSSFSCKSLVSLQVIKRCSDLGLEDTCMC